MNHLKFILPLVLLISLISFSQQDTIKIYSDDDQSIYFDTTKVGYYNNMDRLSDSLTDGVYIFLDRSKKDIKHAKPRLVAVYKNSLRHGEFISFTYEHSGKRRLVYKRVCSFKKGKKEGVDQSYELRWCDKSYKIIHETYSTYKYGKRDGISIQFWQGLATNVLVYNDGVEVSNNEIDLSMPLKIYDEFGIE